MKKSLLEKVLDPQSSAPPVDQADHQKAGDQKMARPGAGHDAGFPIHIERLMLSDFRCYKSVVLAVGAGPVVLCGQNGAGKTNILEAISLLTPGRGLRRARPGDLARRTPNADERTWAVAARMSSENGRVDLGTGLIDPGADKRTVRVDGETMRSQAALAEYMDVQWLTPQMDRLFQDGRAARRRFLDRLVFGYDPAHAGRLNAYETAMRERARLLRDGRGDATWLGNLEDTMVTKGIAIAAARLDLADRLGRYCLAAHGPFPGAGLAIDGCVEAGLQEYPALEAEGRYRAALKQSRAQDGMVGGAAVGPHRSDLVVTHLGKSQAAEMCSTGEQKALLVSIVLADARMTTAERGRVPVLLLDEITAHLDEDRRAALFESLIGLGAQTWLTGTNHHLFEALEGHAQFFTVADAAVTPRAGAS